MGIPFFKKTPTIVPARRIYQSQHDAEFKVDVDIKCCVHGYLARDKKQPATLLLLTAQLVCVDDGTFNLFRLEVDFQDQGKACTPIILSTAPYTTEEHLYEQVVSLQTKLTNTHKHSKSLTASAGLAEGPAKLGLDGTLGTEASTTSEISYTSDVHYFSRGSSCTRVDPLSGRRNSVWWNVKKSTNPKTGDDAGIPRNYVFAVLLLRSTTSPSPSASAIESESETARTTSTPFEAHFRLFSEAGWAHRREKIVEIVARHLQSATTTATKNHKNSKSTATERPAAVPRPLSQELVDFAHGNYEGRAGPVVFDPKVKLEGDCEGIDRMQLGKYSKREELQRLVTAKSAL